MGHCMRLRYKKDLPIHDLPSSIVQNVRSFLDLTRGTEKWREFLNAAVDIGRWYELSYLEAESMGLSTQPSKLVSFLDSRGLTVEELVRILDKMGVEYLQDQLRVEEPLNIQYTSSDICVNAGDPIEMEVSATAFPYPKYQWFRHKNGELEFITGAVFTSLLIRYARFADEGIYRCGVRRHPDEKFTFSSDIRVYVRSSNEDIMCNGIENSDVSFAPNIPLSAEETRKLVSTHAQEPVESVTREETMCMQRILEVISEGERGTESVAEDIDLQITVHPVSMSKDVGDNCSFQCSAECSGTLTYQWFKDGRMIPEATEKEYKIGCINADSPGKYQCKISCLEAQKECLSYVAELEVNGVPPFPAVYTAVDKVALLIGNYEYKGCTSLGLAPRRDIETLSEQFRLLNFKVISLLNLTKTEMKNIVREFVQMLGESEGVYSVFYFCGHGFDHEGNSQLIPVDAPEGFSSDDCVSAQDILSDIQVANPDLAVMILDVCRTGREHYQHQTKIRTRRTYLRQRGNTVFLYATCRGMESYQIGNEHNGVLVKHLRKFLSQAKPVLGIFQDVLEDFNLNPDQSKGKQIPEITTTLMEPKRSFCDNVKPTGHTTTFHNRLQKWGKIHAPPRIRPITIAELGMRVKLSCSTEFANVLRIAWELKASKNFRPLKIRLEGFPKTITVGSDENQRSWVLEDIQKIKDDVYCRLCIEYCEVPNLGEEGQHQIKTHVVDGIYLGLPLIAFLMLWRRGAEEQSEEDRPCGVDSTGGGREGNGVLEIRTCGRDQEKRETFVNYGGGKVAVEN